MTQLVARRITRDDLAWYITIGYGGPLVGFVWQSHSAIRSDATLVLQDPTWRSSHTLVLATDMYDHGTAATRDEAALGLAEAHGITDAVAPEVWP